MIKAIVAALLLFVACTTVATTTYALNTKETVENNISVFGIDGYPVNLTISIDSLVFTGNETLLTFTLTIKEPFSARGTTINPYDYYVSRETLDVYLSGGVLVDFDRDRAINTLWANWADTQNSTYVQEEHAIYAQKHIANFTKSGNAYIGTTTLPALPAGAHNATVWVKAEQDQVTTYIPFWAAFTQTINVIQEQPLPTPIPEITPIMLTVFSATGLLLVVFTKRRL
jgi:hypothetical protein